MAGLQKKKKNQHDMKHVTSTLDNTLNNIVN